MMTKRRRKEKKEEEPNNSLSRERKHGRIQTSNFDSSNHQNVIKTHGYDI